VVKEVEFDGYMLAKGEIVIGILGAADHDPEVFSRPESLDIHRSPNHHIGFGKGIHYCLGAPLARLETEIALNTLLQRMPDLEMAAAIEDLEWMPVPMFRRLKVLPVKWTAQVHGTR